MHSGPFKVKPARVGATRQEVRTINWLKVELGPSVSAACFSHEFDLVEEVLGYWSQSEDLTFVRLPSRHLTDAGDRRSIHIWQMRPNRSPIFSASVRRLTSTSLPAEDFPTNTADGEWLWLTEAIHRANNFAQLEVLQNELERLNGDDRSTAEHRECVDTLAKSYGEVLRPYQDDGLVPCHTLIDEVCKGLVTLFGTSPCRVKAFLKIEETWLKHSDRRALVLLASELVTNAIKHAFQGRDGGVINLSLTNCNSHCELIVGDDGRGISGPLRAGTGTQLIDGFARILKGEVVRTGSPESGFQVAVTFPLCG